MINILPTRFKSDLTGYFREYSLEERKKVRVLVTDMWENYRRLAWLFPNAVVVADRYHWIRQISWALDKVRKRAQKTLPHWVRLRMKRLRHLLHKLYNDLKTEDKIALRDIIDTNTDLYIYFTPKGHAKGAACFDCFCVKPACTYVFVCPRPLALKQSKICRTVGVSHFFVENF